MDLIGMRFSLGNGNSYNGASVFLYAIGSDYQRKMFRIDSMKWLLNMKLKKKKCVIVEYLVT